jgi:hypothetical protein
VVHHVQEAAAAHHVRAVVAHHAQVAVDRLVPVVVVPPAQVAVDRLVPVVAVPRALQVPEEARLAPVVRVVVPHAQAAAALQAIAAALAVVVIAADHAVVPAAVLRSAVLSRLQWMIFSRRKRPLSWKV